MHKVAFLSPSTSSSTFLKKIFTLPYLHMSTLLPADVEGLMRECKSWSDFATKLAPSSAPLPPPSSSSSLPSLSLPNDEKECVVAVLKDMLPQLTQPEIEVCLFDSHVKLLVN